MMCWILIRRTYWPISSNLEIAKDIVVAHASSMNIPVDAESGKDVADFYTQIFNGIAETLGSSKIGSENQI